LSNFYPKKEQEQMRIYMRCAIFPTCGEYCKFGRISDADLDRAIDEIKEHGALQSSTLQTRASFFHATTFPL